MKVRWFSGNLNDISVLIKWFYVFENNNLKYSPKKSYHFYKFFSKSHQSFFILNRQDFVWVLWKLLEYFYEFLFQVSSESSKIRLNYLQFFLKILFRLYPKSSEEFFLNLISQFPDIFQKYSKTYFPRKISRIFLKFVRIFFSPLADRKIKELTM